MDWEWEFTAVHSRSGWERKGWSVDVVIPSVQPSPHLTLWGGRLQQTTLTHLFGMPQPETHPRHAAREQLPVATYHHCLARMGFYGVKARTWTVSGASPSNLDARMWITLEKKRKNNDNNNKTFSLLSVLLIQALNQVWITIKHFCIQQQFPRSSKKLVAWEPGCTEMEQSNSWTISPLHPK